MKQVTLTTDGACIWCQSHAPTATRRIPYGELAQCAAVDPSGAADYNSVGQQLDAMFASDGLVTNSEFAPIEAPDELSGSFR
jgi:hypothetical protein